MMACEQSIQSIVGGDYQLHECLDGAVERFSLQSIGFQRLQYSVDTRTKCNVGYLHLHCSLEENEGLSADDRKEQV